MRKVLAVLDYYLPGYKAGGPVRTVANLIERLGDEFEFSVLTSDRDLGDRQPYSNVKRGIWQRVGKAQVQYLSPQEMGFIAWCRLLKDLQYNLVYLNSVFSRLSIKTLLGRKIGLLREAPIVVAPRGEFSLGALSLKRFKKRAFILLAKRTGLLRNIVWQASSEFEARDILSVLGNNVHKGSSVVQIAPNLPKPSVKVAPDLALGSVDGRMFPSRPFKQVGSARIVFLSRISRMKNLDTALKLLTNVGGQVQFDVYGPIEDPMYWEECRCLMSRLPNGVHVSYVGPVVHDHVLETLSKYHLLLLPTLGENFGHVVLEALCAGCPVLISDQTPWRNLTERRVGWDLPLSEPERYSAALSELVSMDDFTFAQWSRAAREYGEQFSKNPSLAEASRELFLAAMEN